tara:strand:+ start:168 stop:365 length:198 start_codon:yes stop_codon:yes gene_type:complete
MEEAKDYKAYLKALKEATKKKKPDSNAAIKRRKNILTLGLTKMSEGGMCRGMGAAVKGGDFKGVK